MQKEIMQRTATFPKFEDEEDRVKTFRNWPHDRPDGRSMSEAGFFYGGFEDNARCFFCGILLCRWEPDDLPLSEHAEHGSSCLWLRRKTKETLISKINFASEFGFDSDVIAKVVSDHLERKGQVFSLTYEVLVSSIIDFDENGTDDRKKDGVEDPSKHEGLVSLIAELRLEEDAEDERPERKEEEEEVRAPVESYTNKVRVGDDDDNDAKSRGDLLRELTDLKDEMSCKVCMDRDSNVLLTPCNHLVCCDSCSVRLALCPICRTKVDEVVKDYHS
ncbi:baculoviral IAP repeat-containing protein 3-like [Anneissia japonica]|uniref:baculoviral IAP repeat-containing protein 3-like n=1 Tax=Anneissia japonica TaxID=1529436 RepID=UPI0014255149|nr:baculoviral IAP repeat-containing protein 3-like [Anneissia japonica]